MSTNVEPRAQPAPLAVPAGLQALGALPAWLEAAAQPDRVRNALARSIPAFAAGELTLEACEIKRLRFKARTRCWTGSYRFTVAGPQPGQRWVVVLRGLIIPPGMDAPTASGVATAFGAQGWRTYLPDLRLELQAQPEDTRLTMLPSLTDPEQARVLLEQGMRGGPGPTPISASRRSPPASYAISRPSAARSCTTLSIPRTWPPRAPGQSLSSPRATRTTKARTPMPRCVPCGARPWPRARRSALPSRWPICRLSR